MHDAPRTSTFEEDRSTARTVLVVDDSRAQRRLLSRTFEKWGYSAIEAASGEEALDICRSTCIELIVSDWMMPGMSGVEFCRAFRELSAGRAAYFILLTAQTDRETLAEGLESGADDFLSKPFHAVELKARVRAGERVLEAQRALVAKNEELTGTLDKLAEAYEAIESDLAQARKFQQGLVPERHVDLGRAELSILYRPSGHVGGDLVGYFKISDDRFGIYSVDVSGHGVTSALMTARIAALFNGSDPERNIALARGGGMHAPDEVCRRLNALIASDVESDLYLTMALVDMDFGAGRALMSQAGHSSPIICRRGLAPKAIDAFGMPIGLVDPAEFSTIEIDFQPGDRLLLYSDGITECPDPGGELYEEERLRAFLNARHGTPGPEVMESLEGALVGYAETDAFPDDLSAVLIDVR